MSDVWRLASIFGLCSIAFAACANFIGQDVGTALKSPSITDWMQGFGTLGTLFIAIIAFRRWRLPDDAKRRADAAQHLIRLNSQLEASALACRHGGLTVLFGRNEVTIEDKLESLKVLSRKPPRKEIERLRVLRAELLAQETEIETLFGDSALSASRNFLRPTDRIIRSYEILTHMAKPTDFIRKLTNFEKTIDEQMEILGVRIITDDADEWELDKFRDEFEALGRSSRAALAPFLIGHD